MIFFVENKNRVNEMKRIIKKLIMFALIIYGICIFISQQKMLNSYAAEKGQISNQLNEANQEQEELNNKLDSINSTNYIEEMARNKLDMYLPNERVYIDITK